MVELSPKINDKKATKWREALDRLLLKNEVLIALLGFHAMTADVLVITNARIARLRLVGSSEDAVICSVAADEILAYELTHKLRSVGLTIRTVGGEVNFGTVHKSEVNFLKERIERAERSGVDPAVRDALDRYERQRKAAADAEANRLRARDVIPIVGDPLKDKQWNTIHAHSRENELPWFVLNPGISGMLAAFDDRLIISKSSAAATLVANSPGGGGVHIFAYSNIISVQHNGRQVNGFLEVLTPIHHSIEATGRSHKYTDGDIFGMPNCVGVPKIVYSLASDHFNQLQQKIIESKQPAARPRLHEGGNISRELEKLASMHERGLLDDAEFKAAKKAAIENRK